MNVLKSALLGISLTLLSLNTYAQDQTTQSINSAEKSSLASIAAIDKNEILISVIAENKKVDSNVTDFARMMISQHGSNLTQVIDLVNQAKNGLVSSADAEKLARQGKQEMLKIGALQGNEFAKAYADAMVKGHEEALKLIDDKLMKTAKSDEIKTFLTNTRAAVEKHLEHARKLQSQLQS